MTVSEQLCRELAHALSECTAKGRFANSVIQKKFIANKHWTEDERSLFAESLYFIVRNWRRLRHALGVSESDDLPANVRVCLAAFCLNRVSYSSILQPNLRTDLTSLQRRWSEAESQRKLRYSYPDWLDNLGFSLFGQEWEAMVRAFHVDPKVVLRTNTLRGTRDSLSRRLEERGIKTINSSLSEDALILPQHENVFAFEEFSKGLFEVQDTGSQCIAPFCQVEPGMRVIDACAGSGGKSLHIAALMKNKGRIIAMDTEEWKLLDLVKRARRATVSIIETRTITSTKVVKRQADSADRLLLDVPCSGLGVLRRNPDTKWHLHMDDIDRFVKIQRDILKQYSKLVKADGKMVYATCSFLPAECEEQVQWFLAHEKGWLLEEEKRILPQRDDCDAFYMARLRRVESAGAKAPRAEKALQL